jgi:hypothetical protein
MTTNKLNFGKKRRITSSKYTIRVLNVQSKYKLLSLLKHANRSRRYGSFIYILEPDRFNLELQIIK